MAQLCLGLLAALFAPAAAETLEQPWRVEPALSIAVEDLLRAVVLTPRLSEDDAASAAASEDDIVAATARAAAAAQRLNTAQDAAATLLANDTLGWLLADAAVMRTLQRLQAKRGGNASATGRAVDWLSRSQPPVLDANRSSRRRAAARSSSDGGLQSRERFRTTGPPDMVAAAVARPSSARKRLQVDASGGGADVAVCPAAGDAASSLLGSPTEHRQLDFTGGYSSSAHCEWDIRCEHGQVVALHFTALDTEADWDFVSLYDGGSESSSPRIAQLSGSSVPVGVPLGARSGELAVVLTSDGNTEADGFAAEYWCAAAGSVGYMYARSGCTDRTALNFSPAATLDDGSCYFGERVALLAAFQVDPASRAAWDRLRGWDATSDVCGWEGVSCDGRRVTQVDLHGMSELRFTLGAALGNLTVLQRLRLYQTGLSGTLPDSVGGMTRLYDLNLHQTGLSGTLSDSVDGMTGLRRLYLQQTGMSGTLPDSLGGITALRYLYLDLCTKDYRGSAFFWEPLDMLRKLMLSGLLQFVERGSAFQVFCGCVLSFGSCAAQIKVAPYSEPTSNLLKALVEAQIFVTFLISFILRVLPKIASSEPVEADTYGWVLVWTLSGLLVTAVGLTGHQIWLRHRGRWGSSGSTGEGTEPGEGGEVVLELSEGLVLERALGSGAGGGGRK